ncbi:MAG: flippase-like domain-containing protein [Archaeoglobaceae archaeon]|nr:flippase-like domain-containing protein [Archaeoglobaceae archaeon]
MQRNHVVYINQEKKISIILPAYNEARRLGNTVEKVEEHLKALGNDYEIIIAEDGSTDGTDLLAREIARKNPKVKHLHSDQRLGRGKALMRAFKECEGEIVVYMDVDLSTDLKHLRELVSSIISGYDVVTGSRLMRGSEARRSFKRDIASRAYNSLVRLLLRSKIHDHQCGFKAFRREAIMKISEKVKDTHWFWDTEVLIIAQRMGYKVKEIPVKWEHSGETKVRFKRDVLYMFSQIIRMFFEDIARSRKFYLFATILAILLLIILTLFTGVSNFFISLSTIRIEFLSFAIFIYFLSFMIRGYRFDYLISKLGEKRSLKISTFAIMIGQTVNVLTPVRFGDFARAYVFKRYGVSYTSSFGGTAVERLFDILSITFIAFLASLYIGTRNVEMYYAIILALLILFAILALSKMHNFIGNIMQKAKMVLNPKDSSVLFLLSSLIWLSDIVVCYLISLSFGIEFAVIALAVAIGNIVKAIPITPGGIGTYEIALTAIISLQNPQAAFAIAFADHALKNFITVLLGIIALSATNISLREVSN